MGGLPLEYLMEYLWAEIVAHLPLPLGLAEALLCMFRGLFNPNCAHLGALHSIFPVVECRSCRWKPCSQTSSRLHKQLWCPFNLPYHRTAPEVSNVLPRRHARFIWFLHMTSR